MGTRNCSVLDGVISRIDGYLQDFLRPAEQVLRAYPAATIGHATLSENERCRSQGFMRVNHAGEVAAQALYKAQALTARDDQVRAMMEHSAKEEIDHLFWCEARLRELEGHTSYLKPFWFLGAFTIGSLAGMLGDKWNLGFVVEAENQVVLHLRSHLKAIAANDLRSRAILEQMLEDEAHHASTAHHAGATALPRSIKRLMQLCSKVMTKTAYWI